MEQKIYSALAKFADIVKPIEKDASNPFFKSKYATLSHIQEVIKPHLKASGLILVHAVTGDSVTSTVYAVEDGSSVSSAFPFILGKPQENGSAVTYAKRYNTAALLNLDTDADDDGNEAQKTEKVATARPVTKPAHAPAAAQPWFNHYFKDTKNETPEWKQLRADMLSEKFPSVEDYIMDIKKTKKIFGPVEEEIRTMYTESVIPF
jgi:hypothetical protein